MPHPDTIAVHAGEPALDRQDAPVTPDIKYDVSEFSIDRKRTRILYTVNEKGYARPYALDARSMKEIKLPESLNTTDVLVTTQVDSDKGWLTLGWRRAPKPPWAETPRPPVQSNPPAPPVRPK